MGTDPLSVLMGSGSQQQPQAQNQQSLPTSMDDPNFQNDSRMIKAKELWNQYGGNGKAAFYALCKERMKNPMEVINAIIGGMR